VTTRRRVCLVAGTAAAVAAFLVVIPGRRGWFDVTVYYAAVRQWLFDGGGIYDYVVPGKQYGFTYPPFAAVCMVPLAVIGRYAAIAAMVSVSVIAAALVCYWLVDPIARRRGWSRWFTVAIACCLFAAYGPLRDTISFGQVNLILVAIVVADQRLLIGRAHRLGGIGIGLAAAIKLTPAIFIAYLLLAGKRRAAGVAVATAAGATALAALIAPGSSWTFWTSALWQTDRVGQLSYASNQSLMGMVARLDPADPPRIIWIVAVVAVLGVLAYRIRKMVAAGDQDAAFALACVAGCLISPVTWVHHLLWLVPPLVLLVDAGLRAGVSSRARVAMLSAAGLAYLILSSSMVWLWSAGPDVPEHPAGLTGFLGANAFVWICVALLLWLPARRMAAARTDELAGSRLAISRR
jgi:alpha-1,2-mannosyltransferase